jgi:tRNA pseudouridine55 synthase
VISGIALVDKQLGVSSHHVVAQARKALNTKKVGHAGTLDPAASGLLVLGIGSGTRLLTYLVGADKTYRATMRLGFGTTTDDAEGEATERLGDLSTCTDEAIGVAASAFAGEIDQVPSTYSAIKVQGRRAYDLARSGEEVVLKSRTVTVHRLEVGDIHRGEDHIDVEILVECSSGTYIRALARDIGHTLGVGGHLVALRRDRVGPFSVEGAPRATELTEGALLSLAEVAAHILPVVTVQEIDRVALSHGRQIDASSWPADSPLAAIAEGSGELIAIVQAHAGRSRILMGVASV